MKYWICLILLAGLLTGCEYPNDVQVSNGLLAADATNINIPNDYRLEDFSKEIIDDKLVIFIVFKKEAQ